MKIWNLSPAAAPNIHTGIRANANIRNSFLHLACSGVGGSIAGGQHILAPIEYNIYKLFN